MDTMTTVIANRNPDIQRKMRNNTDDPNTEDLFGVFFGLGIMTVSNVMTRGVLTLDHTKTAHDAATLMKEKKIGSVIIMAYGKPFGIVTERDLARTISFVNMPAKCLILSFLASRPLICVSPTQTIQEASDIMGKYNIDHLPVLEKDRIVEMITTRDLAMNLLLQ
jgi:CBS domain-containing protein